MLEVARELKARSHNVLVAAEPDHLLLKKCAEESIAAESIHFSEGLQGIRAITQIRRLIKSYRIDIVHSNSNFDRTYAAFAAKLCAVPHIASIHSEHSIQHNIVHWWRNHFAIDQFLVDGDPTRKILTEQNNIAQEKISVLRLGIDVAHLGRDDSKRKMIRGLSGIPQDAIVIGNVGRLVPFKGHAVLLTAASIVLKQHPAIHFLLVGDGVLREDLERKVSQAGIGSSVHFVGFSDDLPAAYAAMDLYVHPSLDRGGESFPLAVLQALASGLPAVVSRVGDIPLMMDEERNGFLVSPENAEELAARMMQFVLSEEMRMHAGANAAQYIRAHFTTERMVDVLEQVYRRLCQAQA